MSAKVYYVGGDSEHQSLTRLLLELKDDTSEKIIYLNPGVYDIYREYRAEKMPTPPDDIKASDYLERCAFLPANTSLIGLGNVLLDWNPPKDEITLGEARTWSPLNVRYGCHVENISIHCKYGRYCIHDDSHNAESDRETVHRYKNVRCDYEYSEDGKGFNDTIGFGWAQKNRIEFEDCELVIRGCPADSPHHSVFYGHGASGDRPLEAESPCLIIKNCLILGGKENNRTIRLQCLNRVPLRIRTVFESCHIEGGLDVNLYREDAVHAYEVTFLHSGRPSAKIDRPETNPYPIRYFE